MLFANSYINTAAFVYNFKTQTRLQHFLNHKPDDNICYNTQQIATFYYNTRLVAPLTILWKYRSWHWHKMKLCC